MYCWTFFYIILIVSNFFIFILNYTNAIYIPVNSFSNLTTNLLFFNINFLMWFNINNSINFFNIYNINNKIYHVNFIFEMMMKHRICIKNIFLILFNINNKCFIEKMMNIQNEDYLLQSYSEILINNINNVINCITSVAVFDPGIYWTAQYRAVDSW